MKFDVILPSVTIDAIKHIQGTHERLVIEVEKALDDTAAGLQDNIPAQMHWKKPTGTLAGSFTRKASTLQREIGSDLPYSRRRDKGFKGTDSLGRKYNDVGAFYMRSAVNAYAVDFIEKVGEAVDRAMSPIIV